MKIVDMSDINNITVVALYLANKASLNKIMGVTIDGDDFYLKSLN
jgi:hypothetical protein